MSVFYLLSDENCSQYQTHHPCLTALKVPTFEIIRQNVVLIEKEDIRSYEIYPGINYMPVYWIRRDGKMHSFPGRARFIKISPEYKKEIKSFIKSQCIKMEDRDDLIRLVKYCNELYTQ